MMELVIPSLYFFDKYTESDRERLAEVLQTLGTR